jgi:transcriptional regulator with XRE-family HTH domain
MSQQLGQLLQDWRRQRGFSISALAAQAGIAKGTVSGWELGRHQPRLVELDAILSVLQRPPADRHTILALIDAPRARQALSSLTPSIGGLEAEAQPVPGHLLQALRQRRGLRLEDVARELGASASAISRWERSLAAPSPDRLDRLLDLLGASSEERRALTRGAGLRLAAGTGVPSSLDVLHERLGEIARRTTCGDRGLLDLEILAWQAEVWPLAAHSAEARELLASGWAFYSEWLTWDCRMREAARYAYRGLDLLQAEHRRSGQLPSGAAACAVHVCGLVAAQGGSSEAHVRAVEWLRLWLSATTDSWWEGILYRDMAEFAWWAGQPGAAHAFSQRACDLAEQVGDEAVLTYTRGNRADLLLRAGQPHEASAFIEAPLPHDRPYGRIVETLRWARLLRDLRDSTATHWLAEAYALIEQSGFHQFRAEADALAREC